MTEKAPKAKPPQGAPPPPASLDVLFADGQLPAGIAALAEAERADLLALVQDLHQDQIAELVATGPKMVDALPLLVRKTLQKIAGAK